MNRVGLVVLFFFTPLFLFSQQIDSSLNQLKIYSSLCTDQPILDLNLSLRSFRQIQFGAQAQFNSSYVDLGFASSVFNGRFIDNSVKDRVNSRMFENANFIQLGYAAAVQYTWRNDSSLLTHQLSLTDKSISFAEVTKGLYRLALYGNGSEPDLISMGYNELFDTRFRQFNYNIYYKPMNNLMVYAGLGLMQGLRYHHAFLTQASMRTYDYGEKIDLRYRFSYAGVDEPFNIFPLQYIGFTLSGGAVFSSNPEKYQAWVGFNDISTINTRSDTRLYTASTEKTFEGIEVNNLFAISDTSFNNIDTDSLLRFLDVQQIRTGVTDALPFYLHIGYKRNFDNGYLMQIQVAYYTTSLFHYPFVSVVLGKRIRNLEPAITGTIGGYRQPHIGAQLFYSVMIKEDELGLFVRTNTLDAFISPRSRTAANAALGISYTF